MAAASFFCSPVHTYIRNMATIVVAASPMMTGRRFLLASSKGSTLQMAAAGMSAQGTSVVVPIKDI